jgi:ATP-dependent Clp protease, protease subunit
MRYNEIDSTTAELLFYKNIGYWYISAGDFESTMDEIERKYKNLNIRVHCYGGEVFEGNVICNRLSKAKGRLNVRVIVEGVAASMAGVFLLYADEVWIADNAFVMFHVPSGTCWGNSKDMLSQGKLLGDMQDNFVKRLVARTGMSKKDAEGYMDGTDHWLNADECISLKIANKKIDAVEQALSLRGKPDSGANLEQVYNMYGSIAARAAGLPGAADEPGKQLTTMNKKQLIQLFGLDKQGLSEASSDTAIYDAIKAIYDALVKSESEAKAALAKAVEFQCDSLIASYEVANEIKLPDALKSHYKAVAEKAGIEVLAGILGTAPDASAPTVPSAGGTLAPKVVALGGDKFKPGDLPASVSAERKSWSFSKWAAEDVEGLQALEDAAEGSAERALFVKLYNKEYSANLVK